MVIMSVSDTGFVPAHSPAARSGEQPEREPLDVPSVTEDSGLDFAAGGQGRQDLPADRYLDREHSWILFNQRVLEMAEDEQTPLLERVRFLAIFASNPYEFFMGRRGG